MSRPRLLPHHVLSLVFLCVTLQPADVSANLCRVTGGVLGMHWSSALGLGWRPLASGKAGATCWQSCCLAPSCSAVWSLGGNCVQLSCSRARGCGVVYLPQPHHESLGLLQLLTKGPVIQKRLVRRRRSHRKHSRVGTRSTTMAVTDPLVSSLLPTLNNNSSSSSSSGGGGGSPGQTANGSADAPIGVRGPPPGAQQNTSVTTSNATDEVATATAALTVPTAAVRELAVSAGQSVELILPNNEVELNAFVVPAAKPGTEYSFEWHLITHPKDSSGEMEGKFNQTLKLSRLTVGLYEFEVRVDGDGARGQGYVNVTVKPESTDDDNVVAWHWEEEEKGPLRDDPRVSADTPILTLNRLEPGNYTFTLTVTDSDKAQSSTQATLLVNKATDYKPVANAGPNKVITLPRNSITLYGNESTDDHEPLAYEWSLSPLSKGKVVEMQGVRTAALQLSAMQEGDYTFQLMVSDSSGQHDTALVTVIVQPENNKPPVAAAGPEKELTLPVDRTVLDGSKSSDDQKITTYHWVQSSGPDGVKIENADGAVATVTELQVGTYAFTLTVTDDRSLQSSDTVSVIVREEEDLPPVARVLPRPPVVLPVRTAALDGSRSSDDKGAVSYVGVVYLPQPHHESLGLLQLLTKGPVIQKRLVRRRRSHRKHSRVGTRSTTMAVTDPLVSSLLPTLNSNSSSSGGGGGSPGQLANGSADAPIGVRGPPPGAQQNTLVTMAVGATTDATSNATDEVATATAALTVPTAAVRELAVSAGQSVELILPNNEVELNAFVVPAAKPGTEYSFEWHLITHPKDSSGEMEGKFNQTLKLSRLTVGLYEFEVRVDGDGARGQGYVNVTVKPEPRVNKPPVAVVSPKFQEITLPTSSTVIDGSQSTDDDNVVAWHWEEEKGPLRDDPRVSADTPILTLNRLEPGNYTFTLTVTDSDKAQSSTQATLLVNKATDYKPVANAGPNKVITLPRNSITLYGNESTDDHEPLAYEWSLSPLSKGKVVEMQGVRTAALQLSAMQEGDYTFQLMVSDSSGQHDTALVTVIVQPENNKPPVAAAGPEKELTLPVDRTVLDGSKSSDDQKITTYHWVQSSGPDGVKIENADGAVATVTGLQVGTYAFTLTVTDDRSLQSSDTVSVIVREEEDLPPVARVLPRPPVVLPVRTAALDGSRSSDDKGAVSYAWTRDENSPAAGHVLNGSDHQAVLFLGNLVEGKYTFSLTVTDSKGQSSTDRGALEVKPDVWAREEVELVLEVAVSQVTQRQRDMLLRQVGVLLGVLDSDIIIRDVGAFNEHSTRLVFLVSGGPGRPPLSGHSVATGLRNKLRKQKTEFLIFKAHRVDTVICQLNCSGHGGCDAFTRSCVCQPFWMENFLRSQLGDGESNCEWSVLYVTIASFLIVVSIATIVWGMVCCCRRRKSRVRRSKSRYKMLEAEERDGLELQPGRASRLKAVPAASSSALMRSDSDLDSDDGQGGVPWADRERGHLLRPPNGSLRNGQGPARGKKGQREELL